MLRDVPGVLRHSSAWRGNLLVHGVLGSPARRVLQALQGVGSKASAAALRGTDRSSPRGAARLALLTTGVPVHPLPRVPPTERRVRTAAPEAREADPHAEARPVRSARHAAWAPGSDPRATPPRSARRYVENKADMAGHSAAQAAGWPRLTGAQGSLEHALALRDAFGAEPAGRGMV